MSTSLDVDLRDPSVALGLHLFRDPRCGRMLKGIQGLDPRLIELAELAVAFPKTIQIEGFREAAFKLASREAFAYAALLEMFSKHTRAQIPRLRECIDQVAHEEKLR
jgi:hypothetical protein